MKRMIMMVIVLMLTMIPTAAYADAQAEEILPSEETAEEAAPAADIPEDAPEISDNSEAEISPVTEESLENEEESEEEEKVSEEPKSSTEEPDENACEDIEDTLFIDKDISQNVTDEETPPYELARLYVAARVKREGTVDISSFGFKAEEEEELAGYLSMSFDDFYIVEENGILTAVVIGENEDVDLGDEEDNKASYFRDSYSQVPPPASEESYSKYSDEDAATEVVVSGESFSENPDENAATEVNVSAETVEEEPDEEDYTEEPIGFFMTVLVLLATVIKNAANLL